MTDKDAKSAHQIDINQLSFEVANANAKEIIKSLRRREELTFALGFVLSIASEFVRFKYFQNTINEWTLRGCFISIACLVSLLAMISSVSMQSSLKDHGVENPLFPSSECIAGLLAAHDTEGLRLIQGIATAGRVYAFVLGMAIGMCVCIFIQNK